MRRTLRAFVLSMVALSLMAVPVSAQPFPGSIPLPDGFSPEGIAVGAGSTFYVGSLRDGDVYRGDLASGAGELFVDAPAGRIAVGLKADVPGNRLFVAGGFTGQAFVYDLTTGSDLGAVALTTPGTFINDVVVTNDAAWFTDSGRGVLYKVPFLPGGVLGTPEVLTLTGPGAAVVGPFNLNGIDATPDGKTLIVMHSALASLFTVDPMTGVTSPIDVGGPLPNGDGILLDGPRLYVVQNFLNQISEIRLAPDLAGGTVVDVLTADFRIPTTVARHGNQLAAVNARFDLGIPGPATADYDVTLLSR